MDRYGNMFSRLAFRGEGAFGAFVMLGDPDLETSASILDALVAAGADMIEVGIPFSDPVADGPVIQAAATRALAAGVRPGDAFALLRSFRERHPLVPVGILTYANLVLARGRNHFYAKAAEAGVDSVLVADVPLLEAEPYLAAARANHVAPVLIAAPNTPPERLERIAALGGGYTYCVSRAGVTGSDDPATFDHGSLLRALKAAGAPPPVLGFGISRPEHVRSAMAAGAAGVICGSAIVRLIADRPGAWEEALPAFLKRLVDAKAREPIEQGCL
jgi:tryptophan synthase alpha chain